MNRAICFHDNSIFQSPVTTSPATLSPTSIPTRHPTARFPYSPVNSPGEAVSPTHSHGASQVSGNINILLNIFVHCQIS